MFNRLIAFGGHLNFCRKGEFLMALKKAPPAGVSIAEELLAGIVEILQGILYGKITLTAQNFQLVQIERNEKLRPGAMEAYRKALKRTNPSEATLLCRKIQQHFQGLEYGQVVIFIKEGKIIQVERTEKYRLSDFTGLDGEGI